MLPNVSLIIPARNEEKVIEKCIESLLQLDYPHDKLEIIVAIDGSTDKTLEICRNYSEKIRIIESPPKKCKAEALNNIIPKTKGEIVGIYDADCIVEKNCVRNAVKLFLDKEVVAVSGTLKSYNKKENMITRALAIETCMVSYTEHFLQERGLNSIFYGKNSFIRKEILEKLGGFDATSFSEDAELTVRLRRLNYKIRFEPKAITWHEEPPTIRSFLNQRSRWARGIIRVLKKRQDNSIRDIISYVLHGTYFYFPPFITILTLMFLLGLFLNMPLTLYMPLIILFSFNMYIFIISHLFYRESIKNLLFLPVFFVLSNLHIPILLKAWYDEYRRKEIKWYKANRSGRVLM